MSKTKIHVQGLSGKLQYSPLLNTQFREGKNNTLFHVVSLFRTFKQWGFVSIFWHSLKVCSCTTLIPLWGSSASGTRSGSREGIDGLKV